MCAIDITAEQRKTVLALLARHLPNSTAWVYGSRVKWTARPESDLDLVVFAKPEQERRVSDLREAFEESNLPLRVDLFVWDEVPEQFRKTIEAEHVVLVEREERGVGGDTATLRSLLIHTRDGEWGSANPGAGLVPIRVIRGTDFERVRRGDLTTVPIRYLRAEKSARKALKPGDILIETAGGSKGRPTGRTLLIQSRTLEGTEVPFTCASFARFLRVDEAQVNAPYLYWFLQHLYQIGEMERHQVQHTGIARFQFTRFSEEIQVPLPPLPEQRHIAHILGMLDDKIELNRRMNQTLEEMARALFKSWFVDFDPVHAKATLKHHDTNHSPLEGESARGRSPQSSRWGEIKRSYTPQTLEKARTLRQSHTDAEGLLWHYLRNKQLDGYKFRRQLPIGPYIVDFACLSRKLVIELDGGQHAEQHNHDKKREDYLRGKGYRILRFWNNEVFQNCMDVLEAVYQALVGPPPHQPSFGGSATGPPPHQPSPDGSASATPPQGRSDWSVERARAYLDRMDPNIAALFPDRFVDSELGPIPAGWEVGTLGSLAVVSSGKRPSIRYPTTSSRASIPLWGGNGPMAFVPEALVDYPILLTGRVGTLGSVFRITAPCYPSDNTLVLRAKCNSSFDYIRFNLEMVDFEALNRGSTQPLLTQGDLKAQPVLLPPVSVLEYFSRCTSCIFNKIDGIACGSRTLAALRDALLPRLVSGGLRVKDTETIAWK